eukprot:2005014-Pyramimonas_sp.AAC.1
MNACAPLARLRGSVVLTGVVVVGIVVGWVLHHNPDAVRIPVVDLPKQAANAQVHHLRDLPRPVRAVPSISS